jgi:hypothetical protein
LFGIITAGSAINLSCCIAEVDDVFNMEQPIVVMDCFNWLQSIYDMKNASGFWLTNIVLNDQE